VFKLVGPVLIRVELDEAKVNVSKRLEFIEGEMKKTDNQIAAKQGEQTALGDEVIYIYIYVWAVSNRVEYILTYMYTYICTYSETDCGLTAADAG
jgi:hypothetical protein